MGYPVTLRVYDLSGGIAKTMSLGLLGKQIDGIWHTGVVVYGREWFYGGGIQCMLPEEVTARYGMPALEPMELGTTDIPIEVFQEFLSEIAPRFSASTYDLIRNNCNNFSDEVSNFLLGRGIPQYIINLPNEALSTPLGAMLRPMIENMQSSIAQGIPFNNPFNQQLNSTTNFNSTNNNCSPSPSLSTSISTSTKTTSELFEIQTNILMKYSKPMLSSDSTTVKSNIEKLRVLLLEMEKDDGKKNIDGEKKLNGEKYMNELLNLEKRLIHNDRNVSVSWNIFHQILQHYCHDKIAFQVLCILRLAILDVEANEYFALEDSLFHLLKELLTQDSMKNSQQMLSLCSIANAFAHPPCALVLVDKHSGLIDLSIDLLKSQHNGVKQMAAATLYNYSCTLSNNVIQSKDLPDSVVTVLCASLVHLTEESDDMVVLRLLLCVGKLAIPYQNHCTNELLKDLNAEVVLHQVNSRFHDKEMKSLVHELLQFLNKKISQEKE